MYYRGRFLSPDWIFRGIVISQSLLAVTKSILEARAEIVDNPDDFPYTGMVVERIADLRYMTVLGSEATTVRLFTPYENMTDPFSWEVPGANVASFAEAWKLYKDGTMAKDTIKKLLEAM